MTSPACSYQPLRLQSAQTLFSGSLTSSLRVRALRSVAALSCFDMMIVSRDEALKSELLCDEICRHVIKPEFTCINEREIYYVATLVLLRCINWDSLVFNKILGTEKVWPKVGSLNVTWSI